MTPRQWPAATKQRAEKAMAELEAFHDTFAGCTRFPFGRICARADGEAR